jgi:hypothetical protein
MFLIFNNSCIISLNATKLNHLGAPLIIKRLIPIVPRRTQQGAPWFRKSQHDKKDKQNKQMALLNG